MAWLLFGRNETGDLLYVGEVPRGEACGVCCPYCGGRLVARKGPILVHHFAHLDASCAFYTPYDFMGAEEPAAVDPDLVTYALRKRADMEFEGQALAEEWRYWEWQYNRVMALAKPIVDRLEQLSAVHPRRKQRSRIRQANYEVLRQLQAYLSDANAPFPDFERVSDLRPTRYATVKRREAGRYGKASVHFDPDYYAGELWRYPRRKFIPTWLMEAYQVLFLHFPAYRRRYAATREKLRAFRMEQERFARFRLYVLALTLPGKPVFYKIGITSRPDLSERIREIEQDLKALGSVRSEVLVQLPTYAFLEHYLKRRYQSARLAVAHYTEYFSFDEVTISEIVEALRSLPAVAENTLAHAVVEAAAPEAPLRQERA